MSEYMFELLTEEIPAWMHDAAQAALDQQLHRLADGLGEEVSITINSTPRRIAFMIGGLRERENDREEEVKGPPRKAAFDAAGAPTKALDGFLRKNDATADQILEGGDYVRIRRTVAGRGTGEILTEKIPPLIEGIRWPKMMRWGAGEHAYIRPVHSVISLFDEQHLPITIFGTASGTTTRGHRTLSPKPVQIANWNEYVSRLELSRVVVDAMRRRHVMAERARILANEVDGTPSIDASIWMQWQYLTEYPGVVRAEFRSEYLTLPEEVLVTVMRVHQKQLPIRDANGRLTPYFLAVLDNEADPDGNAAYGNSFVTNARFADARFFYDTDRKCPLAERIEQLSHLQFHEKLGNYAQKTDRIVAITAALCAELGIEAAPALEAARLSKTDLVTEMVKEFTDLQGKIGGIYAREEGLPDEVWQAVYDHYLPVNIEDALPRTITGAIVSLADKVDTLAGFFSAGMRPTGSKDPFALRRAAQGIVQILLNRDRRQVRIGVDRLVALALTALGRGDDTALAQDILSFLGERVKTLLETSAYEFAYDEIAATMEAGWTTSLTDLVDRTLAIKAFRDEPNFLSILDSARRIANITGDHTSTAVDPGLLVEPAEQRLEELAGVMIEQIDELIAQKEYRHALETFSAMAPELESFFEKVMVNTDDEKVRSNRMSLLRKVGGAAMKIAGVTRIVVDRRDYRP